MFNMFKWLMVAEVHDSSLRVSNKIMMTVKLNFKESKIISYLNDSKKKFLCYKYILLTYFTVFSLIVSRVIFTKTLFKIIF